MAIDSRKLQGMKIYAIIPARGGSKGLPGKNIRPLAGKPLLAHMIESAKASRHLNGIFVSTDSPQIASIAREWGAQAIDRPKDLANDVSSSESALLHALDHIREAEGADPDLLIMLQCTAPFTSADDIDGTIEMLLAQNADSALAVVPFQHFLWKNERNEACGINHDGFKRERRQDLEPQYLEAGSVYAMRSESFRKEQSRFCGKTVLYVCPDQHRCHEIDDAADFHKAESLHAWLSLPEKERENYRLQKNAALEFPSGLGALVCDFDGVFTDNAVHVAEDGREAVRCDRGDGAGISRLKELGLRILVLSAEKNPVVSARCKKLGIECIQGAGNKEELLQKWLNAHALDWQQIIYLGNDVKDLPCLLKAGAAFAPNDAHEKLNVPNIRRSAKNGGHGFVREICDQIEEAVLNHSIELISRLNEPSSYAPGQKSERAWGSWEVLAADEAFCVKKIKVLPDGILSLQYHNHREEIWKILAGSGTIILDDAECEGKTGDVIRIDRKQVHRISNTGNEPLVFLEVQTGDELREDDIVRLADKYHRTDAIRNKQPL